MNRFFVDSGQIEGENIRIIGPDVNHIKNVLRLDKGDEIRICNGQSAQYCCIIETLSKEDVLCRIISEDLECVELPVNIFLFQGLPKQDKMEWIIQKTVELGVHEIIPVEMKRSIVKIDAKSAEKKVERWQKISESAAKQSKRGVVPLIKMPHSFKDALVYAHTLDTIIVPYENADGMTYTREIIRNLKGQRNVGVFIGPEGGFDDQEIVRLRESNAKIISLGKRILRTETAGLSMLAMMVFELEED